MKRLTTRDLAGCPVSLNAGYMDIIKKLADYEDVESEGRLIVLPCKPGDEVWIVERSEHDEPCDYSCYMFLASVSGAVICTAFINNYGTIEETIEYHVEETQENFDTNLAVFPMRDCYLTREEAKKALEGANNE